MTTTSRLAFLAGALLLGACGSGGAAGSAVAPDTPTAAGALGEDTPACGGLSRRPEPLVVDWRSSDRADLEVAMNDGLAVVHYGCDGFRLLKACSAKGNYGFAGVRRKEDLVVLTGSDEVRANLPIASAGLKAEIDRGQTIDLALVVVGKRRAGVLEMPRGDLVGDCDGATHVVRAASVGAFAVATGTRGKVASAAELFGAGTSGVSASERKSVSKDGDPKACADARSSDSEPPEMCGSVLRVELVEVAAERTGAAPPSGPTALENPCADGMVLAGGKCTRKAQEGYRCARDDEAECTAQCDAGNGDSCHNLSFLKAKDRERARALADKACSLGSGDGCQSAAYHRDGKDPEWLTFMAKACEMGQGDACHIAGTYIERGDARASADEARRMLERACDLRSHMACVGAAWWHLRRGDWKAGTRSLAASCEGADGPACGLLGAFHIRCAYGRVAGMAMGDVALCKKFPDPDAAVAAKVLGKACTHAWMPGVCQIVAQMHREGKLVKKDVAQAVRYYEIGCATGGWGTCQPLAEMFEKGDGVPLDPARAKAARAGACKQGDKAFCDK